jgi:hypothetical protein
MLPVAQLLGFSQLPPRIGEIRTPNSIESGKGCIQKLAMLPIFSPIKVQEVKLKGDYFHANESPKDWRKPGL